MRGNRAKKRAAKKSYSGWERKIWVRISKLRMGWGWLFVGSTAVWIITECFLSKHNGTTVKRKGDLCFSNSWKVHRSGKRAAWTHESMRHSSLDKWDKGGECWRRWSSQSNVQPHDLLVRVYFAASMYLASVLVWQVYAKRHINHPELLNVQLST